MFNLLKEAKKNRFVKIIIATLLAFIGLILTVYTTFMEWVDYQPYFHTSYYEKTKDRLEEELKTVQLTKGAVHLGMAKVNMTPIGSDLGMDAIPMAGYGSRAEFPAKGVHDSLFIKTLALKVKEDLVIFVNADMLIIPPNVVAATQKHLNENLKLNRKQLFFTATHTHASIGGFSENYVGESFSGTYSPQIVDWLGKKMAAAIELAINDLKIGKIGYDYFEAPELTRNRIVGELGQEHTTFSYIVAHQKGGKKAIMGTFSAHATTLGHKNLLFSADYPGYWYKAMEAVGYDLPIFCAGGVGSHSPEVDGEAFEKSEKLGNALGKKLIRDLRRVSMWDSISLAHVTLELEMPEKNVRLSNHIRLRPYFSKFLFPLFSTNHLQSLRINKFIWTTTPADYSGESALKNQNHLYKKGFHSTISSFNGNYIGYLIPAKYYHYDHYEARLMSWYGPNMGPYMEELIFRMTDELRQVK
jgi:hypothetical protein